MLTFFQSGNHRCVAWKTVWDSWPEEKKQLFYQAGPTSDHDDMPRPLWCAHILDQTEESSKLSQAELAAIRINPPEQENLEDDLASALANIKSVAGDLDLLTAPDKLISNVLASSGYQAIVPTHLRKILRVQQDFPELWSQLNDHVFKPSLASAEKSDRATLKKTVVDVLYAIFDSGESRGSTVNFGPRLLRWLPAAARMDDAEKMGIYSALVQVKNAFKRNIDKNDYLKRLRSKWDTMTEDERNKATDLQLTEHRARPLSTRRRAKKSAYPAKVAFCLRGFTGEDISEQVEAATKWMMKLERGAAAHQQLVRPRVPASRIRVAAGSAHETAIMLSSTEVEDSEEEEEQLPEAESSAMGLARTVLPQAQLASIAEHETEQTPQSMDIIEVTEESLASELHHDVRGFIMHGSVFDFLHSEPRRTLLREFKADPDVSPSVSRSLIFAADIPYFLDNGKEAGSWDNLSFAHEGSQNSHAFCSNLVTAIISGLHGLNVMGFIFCSHAQSADLFDAFQMNKLTRPDIEVNWGVVQREGIT